MSLEDKIERLAIAMEENTKRLDSMLGKAAATLPASGTKAAAPAAAKPAAAAAAAKPAATAAKPADAKAKAPTVDDIAAAFGKYLKSGTAEERDLAKANVRAIVTHFGVVKATELDVVDMPMALKYLAMYEAGEEPEYPQAEGGEEDGGDGESLV